MKKISFITGVFLVFGIYLYVWREYKVNTFAQEQPGRAIELTDGTKHSIPLEEILDGGPPKDGIPSIDNPIFVSIGEAGAYLKDSEPGISIEMDGTKRFYPFQILVWHEIVNDTVNGKRVLVSYCPLCYSGIVFDPQVNGKRVEFGTSGKLWRSNLLMYDRKTGSLWSQILGEAVMGEATGAKLKLLPSSITRFGNWRKLHPYGRVLSRDTGVQRRYGMDPYGDYYTSAEVFFPVGEKDDRLKAKEFILGVVINNQAKAYRYEAVKKRGKIEDMIAGKFISVEYKEDIDAVAIYRKKKNGTLERINPFPAFWFSWVAAHPQTQLYK